MKSENEKDFFISYRTIDEGWAAWIAWQLEAAGYTTFLQAWDFRPGHNFVSQMQVGVTSGVRTLAVLTPSYFESGFARAEWFAAFAQDPTGEKGLLLPVRVEECNVEGLLGQIIYVNFVGLDEEAARQRLLEGLQQKRVKPTIPPHFPGGDRDSLRPKPAFPASNPYRGLEPFRAEHRLAFKGRDRYIEAVLKKLHEKRLVAIVGASGSGKSSLALAGVLPALADAGWLTATCRPRLNPFIELARALMKYLEPSLTELGPLWEAAERYAKQLRNTPGDVGSLLSFLVECNNKQGLVVLIDQFEELFLSVVHADHAAFIALIAQVWRNSSVPVRWLITLRADFMEVALQGEALTAMLQDADVKLGPMDKEELRAVIIEPASALDVSFAPGLPERLIHDAIGAGSADSEDGAKDGREGRLPLLEFALQQLWERQQDSVIHHAAYDDSATGIGGLQGALRRHAEQVYTRLDDEQKARTRRLFHRLVEQGPDLRDVRRILPRWEVADDWETLVVPLANARLLTTNEPAPGQATVEVIHEQLLRAWPDLRRWIDENREFDYWRQGLTELVTHWQEAPLPEQPDLLLRGTQLDKALVYLSERGDDLKFERSFIIAGQAVREETAKQTGKQRHRLIAWLVVFLSFMALLAMLAAWQWWRAEGQTELARKQTELMLARTQVALASINKAASLYESSGQLGEAEPLFVQSLTLSTEVFGNRDPRTITSLNNLASLYQSQGRYGEAEPLYQRALTAREKVLGPAHPDTLTSVNNLAGLYQAQGRYGEAEPLYQGALAAREKVLGPEHPDTLRSVNDLAGLYESQGRYGEAEPRYQRALAAREKVLGPAHPDTLRSVNDLAGLYESQGRYGEAEPLYKGALAAREKVLGPAHPATLTSVNNLAGLYQAQGRYEEAEPLYQRALAAREKVLGPAHPDTLQSVNGLAALYQAQGRYGEAEPLYQRALAAREKVLGPAHPDTLNTQFNYTVTLVNLKQSKRALQMLQRMEPRLLEFAALQLRHTRQEGVRRLFLMRQSNFQDVVLTLALSNPEPDYLDLAAKVMLRWKQIQGEEEASLARLVRRHSQQDSELGELARQIADLRRDFSHLANLPEPDADLQRKKLNELEAKEIRLTQISREFNRHLQVRSANVDDVRHSLPHDSGALLELRLYHPANFKTGEFGELHWAALLLSAAGEMSLHDLGPVAATRDLAQKLRETHARADAAVLYNNLFGTLDEKLKRYEPLYIAPDGFLSLLAFAELVTPDGQYWVQRQTLRQVSTGRHLIAAYDQDLDKPKGLLALGGVDYEEFGTAKEAPPKQPLVQADQNLTVAMGALPTEIGHFMALHETDNEARQVAYSYWDDWNTPAQVWLGAAASESRLKTLATPPRVLHLATASFYLSEKSGVVDRPMVLSGLALAGANQGFKGKVGPDGEDGILYALEVQDLNLENTELVTLSGGDSGVGTLDYSEGVYGLVRAFHTAGARHVLMSLWPLGDRSAREFIVRFYRNWLNGPKPKDLAVALRDTQLSFIKDDNEPLRDPKVWAPFVLVEGP